MSTIHFVVGLWCHANNRSRCCPQLPNASIVPGTGTGTYSVRTTTMRLSPCLRVIAQFDARERDRTSVAPIVNPYGRLRIDSDGMDGAQPRWPWGVGAGTSANMPGKW